MKTSDREPLTPFDTDYKALLVFVGFGVALFTLGPIYALYHFFFQT